MFKINYNSHLTLSLDVYNTKRMIGAIGLKKEPKILNDKTLKSLDKLFKAAYLTDYKKNLKEGQIDFKLEHNYFYLIFKEYSQKILIDKSEFKTTNNNYIHYLLKNGLTKQWYLKDYYSKSINIKLNNTHIQEPFSFYLNNNHHNNLFINCSYMELKNIINNIKEFKQNQDYYTHHKMHFVKRITGKKHYILIQAENGEYWIDQYNFYEFIKDIENWI